MEEWMKGTIQHISQVRSELVEALGQTTHDEFSPQDGLLQLDWYWPRRFREGVWLSIRINTVRIGNKTELIAGHTVQHAHDLVPTVKEILDKFGIANILWGE